jgi:outer membrane biosynthesis protein TonB
VGDRIMFDPYHKWLGIPPVDQPPNHYRLLALNLFESDTEVIDAAANRQMAYLQQRAIGNHAACSQKLLNEVAAARLCLLNPQKKTEYDAGLKAKPAPEIEDSPPTLPTTTVPPSTEPQSTEPQATEPSPDLEQTVEQQQPVPTESTEPSPHLPSPPRRRRILLALGGCLALALVLIPFAVLRRGHQPDATTAKHAGNDVAAVQSQPQSGNPEDLSKKSPGTTVAMPSTGSVQKDEGAKITSSHSKKLFPAGGWPQSGGMEVFRVDHTGSVPAPDTLPRFILGKAHPKKRNWPTFVVNALGESSLDLKVHAVPPVGAVLECYIDGVSAERFDFPTSDKVSYLNQIYHISIPSGQHEIQLRSTGKGWIHVYWYWFQGSFADPK